MIPTFRNRFRRFFVGENTKMNKQKTIGIIGYGRFGPVLYKLLKDDFSIIIFRRSGIEKSKEFTKNTKIAKDVSEIYENSNVIFYATPIETFDEVIRSHKKYFKNSHLLIDTLSVKTHPERIFKKYLKGTKTQAILTHPMFGPDSSKNGFSDLPIIMNKFLSDDKKYNFWKTFFTKKKLKVVELSAREHDKLAANSQGLTHFVGRLLDAFGMKETPIDSLGAKKLLEVKEQTCHDTWQLFENLQHYNPYTKNMRVKLDREYNKLFSLLQEFNK